MHQIGKDLAAVALEQLPGNHVELLSGLGVVAGLFFLSLLLVPGMPGFLSIQSRIALAAWTIMGIVFFFYMRNKYLGNKDDMDTILHDKGVEETICPVLCQE